MTNSLLDVFEDVSSAVPDGAPYLHKRAAAAFETLFFEGPL